METLQTGQYNEMNENESYQKENPPNFRRHKKEEILLSQWEKKRKEKITNPPKICRATK